jgi:hypothetical protein
MRRIAITLILDTEDTSDGFTIKQNVIKHRTVPIGHLVDVDVIVVNPSSYAARKSEAGGEAQGDAGTSSDQRKP